MINKVRVTSTVAEFDPTLESKQVQEYIRAKDAEIARLNSALEQAQAKIENFLEEYDKIEFEEGFWLPLREKAEELRAK